MKRALLVAVLALVGTVSMNPHCAGALLAQSEPQMPPEGNPDHVQPPDGAWCDHTERAAHACACHAKCVEGDDGQVRIEEDGTHCRAYCYRKFCRCPADNCQAPTQKGPRP